MILNRRRLSVFVSVSRVRIYATREFNCGGGGGGSDFFFFFYFFFVFSATTVDDRLRVCVSVRLAFSFPF